MSEHSGTSITGGHANAVAGGAAGFISGTDQLKLDGIAAAADVALPSLATHTGNTSNPHTTTAAQVGAPPTSRQFTGSNGIAGGGDLSADRNFSPTYGTAVNTVCQGNDSRLADAVTALANAATAQTTANTAVSLAGAASATASAAQTSANAHATRHVSGGADPLPDVVPAGASGLMTGAQATKLAAITPAATRLNLAWGVVAAPATVSARYLQRSAGAVSATLTSGEYVCTVAGTLTVTIVWAVANALATDSCVLTLMNAPAAGGASAATTVTATMAAGALNGSGSASITLAVGDRLAIRTVQSSTEAQAAWNLAVGIVG